MEIPLDVLENVLKCSECETYLTRGPVYLQHDGAAVCGVCVSPNRPATRNEQYEATAKLLLFPCKNRELGCRIQVPFVQETEVNGHEEVCQYRQYVCPILGSARCDWFGSNVGILKHCEEQHVDKVKDNPVTLMHDISKFSEQTFLLRAFQVLFLLHVKICVTSGKIFHAIRYLGLSDNVKNFSFDLNIKRGRVQFSKKHQVAPQGCLSIQEDISLAFSTNSLLDMFGGYDGTKFTVTLSSVLERWAKCRVIPSSFLNLKGIFSCTQCLPAKVYCYNRKHRCTYKDIDEKCDKHFWFFCEKGNYCSICDEIVTVDSRDAHYNLMHKIEYSGSTWRAKWTGLTRTKHFLWSAAGRGVCRYVLNDSMFIILIYVPVLSEQLYAFQCMVCITQLGTGQTTTYTPDIVYNCTHDWCVRVNKNVFLDWNHEFDVCVDITKISALP